MGSLTQIYADICQFCSKPEDDCKDAHLERSVSESRTSKENRFAVLGPKDHSKDYPLDETQAEGHCHVVDDDDIPTASSKEKPSPQLVDDALSDAIELRRVVQVIILPILMGLLQLTFSARKWTIS